jgi:cell division protease FtsH
MEGYWGMGHTVSSYSTARRLEVGSPGGGRGGPPKGENTETKLRAALADRIEDQLGELLDRAEDILRQNRTAVLAIAHALETHKTLTGEDVEAVVEGREGLNVDGRVYRDQLFMSRLEDYHAAAAGAHRSHTGVKLSLPAGGHRVLPAAEEEGDTAAATPYEPSPYEPSNGQAPRHYEPGHEQGHYEPRPYEPGPYEPPR